MQKWRKAYQDAFQTLTDTSNQRFFSHWTIEFRSGELIWEDVEREQKIHVPFASDILPGLDQSFIPLKCHEFLTSSSNSKQLSISRSVADRFTNELVSFTAMSILFQRILVPLPQPLITHLSHLIQLARVLCECVKHSLFNVVDKPIEK